MGFFDDQIKAQLAAAEMNLQDVTGLSQQYVDPENFDVLNRLQDARKAAASLGIDPTIAEPQKNLFWEAVDLIGRPQQYLYGVADAAIQGTGESIFEAAYRGDVEDLNASEILRRAGWAASDDASFVTKLATNASRGLVGFGLDVATDPLSFIPGLAFGKKLAGAGVAGLQVSDKGADLLRGLETVASKTDSIDVTGLTDTVFSQLHKLHTGKIDTDLALARIDEFIESTAPAGVDELGRMVQDIMSGDLGDIFDLKRQRSFDIDVPFLGWFDEEKNKRAMAAFQGINWKDSTVIQKAGWAIGSMAMAVERALGIKTLSLEVPGELVAMKARELGGDTLIGMTSGMSNLSDNLTGSIKNSLVAAADVAWDKVGGKASVEAFQQAKNLDEVRSGLFDVAKSSDYEDVFRGQLSVMQDTLPDNPSEQLEFYRKVMGDMRKVTTDTDALKKLDELEDQLTTQASVVEAGSIYNSIRSAAQKTKNIAEDLTKTVGGYFSTELKYGEDVSRYTSYFRQENAASSFQARYDMGQAFGDNFMSMSQDAMTSLSSNMYGMHHAAFVATKDKFADELAALDGLINKKTSRELFEEAQGLAQTGAMDEQISNLLTSIDGKMRAAMADMAKADPQMAEAFDYLQRSDKLSQKLLLEEKKHGIGGSKTVGIYLPSMYLEHIVKRVDADPAKAAKHRSFVELLERPPQDSIAPLIDAREAFRRRAERSYRAIAEKRFINRMSLNSFLPVETIERLQRSARLDPNGPEARLLDQYGDQVNLQFRAVAGGVGEGIWDATFKEATLTNHAKDFFDETFDDFTGQQVTTAGLALDDAAVAPFEEVKSLSGDSVGWTPIVTKGEAATMMGDVEYAVPPIIKEAHEEARAGKMYWEKKLSGPAKKLLKYWDSFNQFNKRMVVNVVPASHLTQLLGDTGLLMMEHGLDVASPVNSMEIVATMAGNHKIKTRAGNYLDKDYLEGAFRRNGFEVNTSVEYDVFDKFNESTWSLLDSKHEGWGSKISQMLLGTERGKDIASTAKAKWDEILEPGYERLLRRQSFVGYLKKGYAEAEAARLANKDLIDYKDLTPFERSIAKRVFFFYGFLKGSSKKVFKDMFLRPTMINRQVAQSGLLANVFSAEGSDYPTIDEYMAKALRSEGVGEGLSFVTGRGPDGKPEVSKVNVTPLAAAGELLSLSLPNSLAFSDVVRTAATNAQETGMGLVAKTNPVISTAFEMLSGKNAYFGVPTSAKFIRKVPDLAVLGQKLSDYQPGNVPAEIVGEAIKTFGNGFNKFLGAVPTGDKEGNFVSINPAAYAVLTRLIPIVGRELNIVNKLVDPQHGLSGAFLTAVTPISPRDGEGIKRRYYEEMRNLQGLIEETTGGSSVKKTRRQMIEREFKTQ